MSSITVVQHRVRQGIAALRARRATVDIEPAAGWLQPDELELFQRMAVHDRAHSLRVAACLLEDDATQDLVAAALLHDVAKAGTPAINGRVRLTDRVLWVLLGRFAPGVLARLTTLPGRTWCRGLTLAVHHARLGAELARAAGSSERTCWLIAAHETSDPQDAELRRLVAADAASI